MRRAGRLPVFSLESNRTREARYTDASAFPSLQPPSGLQPSLKHERVPVIKRPVGSNPFEFAVVSGLRAAQLMRGCIPRVDRGTDKVITTAQMEVAAGLVARVPLEPPVLLSGQ